ncbi:hypothetical protein Hypma_009706 [Hypsizygus marmoreus]|uniref:Uncharacterized protein n=1 Tax=Hypsizygus marmoreus TaxID=39966 RepID=A0A369JMW3_HYPMA|nr:hypothetical protein Hypma_009706 [Hypsizygus marmoreus]
MSAQDPSNQVPGFRKTRLGTSFSPWHDIHVTPANEAFNFDTLLLAGVESEGIHQYVDDDLEAVDDPSGESDLSSVPSSPFGGSDLSSTPPSPEPALQPLPATDAPSTRLNKKARRNKKKGHSNRKHKRQETKDGQAYGAYEVCPRVRHKFMRQSEPIDTPLIAHDVPVASTGFIGQAGAFPKKEYVLDDLVGPASTFGIQLVKWDGHSAIPIVDSAGRVIALLAGHPDDASWPKVAAEAASKIESTRGRCWFPKKRRRHRRGRFAVLSFGVSFGGGQTRPCNLKNSKRNRKVLDELISHDAFKRLAGFGSAAFATWAPRLYAHYQETLGALFERDPSLRPNFPSSIFPAATINFGPRTICYKHKDFANLPFGWCAITALGSFDPTHGGHLILWDCHLVIEFLAGSTALIPSSVIAHSNTTVGEDEQRYSFTQYASGGLFRWVSHGFQKDGAFFSGLSSEDIDAIREQNRTRWEEGLSLLPTLAEVKNDVVV